MHKSEDERRITKAQEKAYRSKRQLAGFIKKSHLTVRALLLCVSLPFLHYFQSLFYPKQATQLAFALTAFVPVFLAVNKKENVLHSDKLGERE